MLGGLSLYIYQRDRHAPVPVQAPVTHEVSSQDFILEITPTFSPELDPFALQGDAGDATSLVVRTAQRELFRAEGGLERGVPIRVQPVRGLVEGRNELYLQAQPPVGEAHRDHAVRVRLLWGNREIFDETLWGLKGANVTGTIPFTLTATVEDAHDH
jgi:hypothetical protein